MGLRDKKQVCLKGSTLQAFLLFLIDGFNFYYSIVCVQKDSNIKAKCFNYRSLSEFYKNDFQSKKQNYQLEINEIYYFTSLIKYNQVLEDMCIVKANRGERFLKIN
jgi:hypothetical protein